MKNSWKEYNKFIFCNFFFRYNFVSENEALQIMNIYLYILYYDSFSEFILISNMSYILLLLFFFLSIRKSQYDVWQWWCVTFVIIHKIFGHIRYDKVCGAFFNFETWYFRAHISSNYNSIKKKIMQNDNMKFQCIWTRILMYNLLIAYVQIRTSRFLIRPDFEMTE